ncbi:GNAT family N-acetyltransferase [Leptolyngbya sp. 7M]|uniref:GNAT family N-acetyltransferase n=1 Tax=Leptolyngbya sp. 7M TaxID=2812896 RepID=UPI001B8B5CF1|nr:GNAT family N-acetyltransferase [Leptolyngbya sp. 7M]QYO65636.1 GNAT family N-acetyltransferase [Leptolyngbya sp. 7M]
MNREDLENLRIVRASGDDAAIVSVLGGVTFYEAYFEQDTPSDLSNYIIETFAPEVIKAEFSDPAIEYYLAMLNGKAVGFIKLMFGTEAEGIDPAVSIELKRIYTLERVWGRGVGDRLMRFAIERARELGFQYLWLGVWQENSRALGFYEKYGFDRVGTITFPYGDSVGINKVLRLKI